ncbi:hypothetical protein A2U01_0031201 [Trifolium medium]|uniref:Uncharacterized protein n=1 Tax=Trifolium medium TaxID=97028 RepID=A0A392PF52_9FABA|nr:hypothetical protein [Trifolium medium]
MDFALWTLIVGAEERLGATLTQFTAATAAPVEHGSLANRVTMDQAATLRIRDYLRKQRG